MKPQAQRNYIDANMVLRKNGLIAFVLRQNTNWMNGYYCLPAGRVDPDETFFSAAIREAKEEAGVEILAEDVRFVHVLHRREETDWVSLFFEAEKWKGEIHNAEPHMHASLDWLDPANLPENVVPSVAYAIQQIQQGIHYGEIGWDT